MKYEIYLWFLAILYYFPGNAGCYLRRCLLPSKIDATSKIWDRVHIDSPRNFSVGCNSSINRGGVINCGGGVTIGSNVLVGPNVTIYSQNHQYSLSSTLIRCQGYQRKAVVIEDDVWIAANVTILPGVRVAQGCVIAAGAIVANNTERYGVYAGVPAKKIGIRE